MALRDASLRFRPRKPVVEGTAVTERVLLGHFETYRFTIRGTRRKHSRGCVAYFVLPLCYGTTPEDRTPGLPRPREGISHRLIASFMSQPPP
jgi:hypothetical protein